MANLYDGRLTRRRGKSRLQNAAPAGRTATAGRGRGSPTSAAASAHGDRPPPRPTLRGGHATSATRRPAAAARHRAGGDMRRSAAARAFERREPRRLGRQKLLRPRGRGQWAPSLRRSASARAPGRRARSSGRGAPPLGLSVLVAGVQAGLLRISVPIGTRDGRRGRGVAHEARTKRAPRQRALDASAAVDVKRNGKKEPEKNHPRGTTWRARSSYAGIPTMTTTS